MLPTFTSVELIPEAIPLSGGGAEFMIDALLGDANMPIPLPTKTRGTTRELNVVVWPRRDSMRKPMADTTSPIVEISLAPYLSESLPLIGPKNDSDIDVGTRKRPAT